MRRVAVGFLGSGMVLLVSGWLALTGPWSVVASAASITWGALLLAVALEEAEPAPPRRALTSEAARRAPAPDAAA